MKVRVVSFIAALALLYPSSTCADEALPDAATIRANVKAAAAEPRAYRMTTVTTSSNGITTTVRHVQRGDDYRDVIGNGPFHDEQGLRNGQAWHQNDNGQTVLDEPDPGVATPDPITTTVTRQHAPLDAYVVSALNRNGWGTRRFVDPATWRVLRDERITANGTIVTTNDDYRADGGRTFEHHWTTVNAYTRTTSDTRVTAYDTSPVGDDDIAIPNSRRQLVAFSTGIKPLRLPARFGNSAIFVRVTIKGRGLDFVLDTGCSGITIDSRVARELGLTPHAPVSEVAAQRFDTARTIVPEMRVGDLVMRDVAVQIVPDGTNEEPDVKVVGLLGFDFLAELGVTIDYENRTVTAVPETMYQPPAGSTVIPLDVRIGSGSPYVDVKINGALSERFLIDTGGAGTLMIFDAFNRKHPGALKDMGGGGNARLMSFYGIGGEIQTKPYQLESVKLGRVDYHSFVGYLVTSKHSYANADIDGLVGVDFLRFFTLGLDYGNSRIYLVPNGEGRRAMGLRN